MKAEHVGEYWLTVDEWSRDRSLVGFWLTKPKRNHRYLDGWCSESGEGGIPEGGIFIVAPELMSLSNPEKPVRVRLTVSAALLGEGE